MQDKIILPSISESSTAIVHQPKFRNYEFNKNTFILGCPVAQLTLEQTIIEVHKIIGTRKPHQHCVVNAGKLVLMHRDPMLRDIVCSCPLINADGQSVVWTSKLMLRPVPERVTGIDLMERLFIEADKRCYRVYFLGASPIVMEAVLRHIKKNFSGIIIAGFQHGYFTPNQNNEIVQCIATSNADILFVAMGSPKKEYWIAHNLSKLNVPFCMGVGGSFDVLAGRAKRAPKWIQKIGMEWFFRFIQEPRRLWRRYWIDNFIFIYLVICEILKLKISLKKKRSSELLQQEVT